MKHFIPFVVFLFLFSGCTKKAGDPSKKEEPAAAVALSEPLELETDPPRSDGVLLDDLFFLEEEIPPRRPEPQKIEESETLRIDTIDATDYLEYGGTFQDTIYVGAQPVGFQSTEFSRQTIQERPVLEVIVRNQLQVACPESPVEISAAHRSFETLQGELITCQSKILRNNVLIDQTAAVKEEHLEITTTMDGETTQEALPWRIGARTGGLCAIQVSLLKNPMQDQEERRLSFYDPTRQAVVETILAAKDLEKVNLSGETLTLRRVETIFKAPKEHIPITFWTDGAGNIVQMSMPFREKETLTTIRTMK